MPPLAAGIEFLDAPLAVFGLLLVAGALLAGIARRSVLSLAALFVVAGLILGQGGFGALELDPRGDFVQGLAVIALILILFRDGLEVEAEMLQKAWHLPFRKLALAMPLTATLVALVTHALTDLGWTESFLVGALLSPTDPVLSSTVVTNPRVPRVIRHSLNLESGLNDGLALPAVLEEELRCEDGAEYQEDSELHHLNHVLGAGLEAVPDVGAPYPEGDCGYEHRYETVAFRWQHRDPIRGEGHAQGVESLLMRADLLSERGLRGHQPAGEKCDHQTGCQACPNVL